MPPGERDTSGGLAFFGAITASVTHELNNILGTVDQISGLLEDLAYNVSQGDCASDEQLNSLSRRIMQQTERGTQLVKRLNTFAHTCDKGISEFSLYDTLENMTSLVNRLARMKRSSIEVVPPADEIVLKTSPFRVMQAVFLVIRTMLPLVRQDTPIRLSLSRGEAEVVVTVAINYYNAEDNRIPGEEIATIVELISGRIDCRDDDSQFIVEIGIPAP